MTKSTQKTNARFSRLLRRLAWKWNGSILAECAVTLTCKHAIMSM